MEFDPALLFAILNGGSKSSQLDPQIENLKQQVMMLRQQRPTMEMRNAGAMQVAPGWGQALAGIGGSILDQRMMGELGGLQRRQADIRSDQNNRVMEALIKMRTPPAQNQPMNQPAAFNPYEQFRIGMGI